MLLEQPFDVLSLIDERYPIADLDGAGAAMLAECQQQIEQQGWCSLEGFINTEALAQINQQIDSLLLTAQQLEVKRTIYQGAVEGGDGLRAQAYVHRAQQLASDQIPLDSLLQQLYCSEHLTEFIRRVQGKQQLYRCADRFQALNVVSLAPGSGHAWHYDTTECTVTLLLQPPENGGVFTFIANSRTDEDEDIEAVERLLSGDHSQAQTLSRDAGTLTLFRGGYSLHGVTAVEGERPRVSAVLTYAELPGVTLSDEVNIRIYGERVEKLLQQQACAQ